MLHQMVSIVFSTINVFINDLFRCNCDELFWAGKLNRVARDEAHMGCKLVHYWWALERTIFSEVDHSFDC